jgi:hypothetical protein
VPAVVVRGLPAWMPVRRLLGDGAWAGEPPGDVIAELAPPAAADLAARLRGLVFAGIPVEVEVSPALPRALVRAARTEDARRRRDTTPGFTRPGAKLDEEGRYSLTPEVLALAMGRQARGHVIDAFAGCGGNAIGFARAGCRVTAIERDPGRLALARHNARIYGVDVDWRGGDALALLPELAGDLLFLDPPWADPELPLLFAALHAGRQFPRIWAKVPPAFDPARVPGAIAEPWFGAAEGDYRRVKFVLLRR